MTRSNFMTVSQSLQTAAQQLSAGKISYAKSILEQVMSVDPDNVDALHLMSLVHYSQGRLAQAINSCKRAVDLLPNNTTLLNNLGNLYKAVGDFEAAKLYYGRSLEIDRGCFPALFNLAHVLAQLGDSDAAIKTYRAAAAIQSDYPDLYYNLGIELRKSDRIEEAISSLNEALKLKSDHVEALSELGNCHANAGKFEDAVKYYRQACTDNNNSASLQNNLGVALTNLGDLEEAKKHLRLAIRLKSDFSEAINNLAVALSSSREFEEAEKTLSKLVEMEPGNAAVLRNYGQTLNALGQFEKSTEVLKRSVELDRSYFEGWLDLAVSLVQLQCDEEAHEAFKQAGALQPQAVAPRWGLTMTRLKSFYDREDEIEESFKLYEEELNQLRDTILADVETHAGGAGDAMRFVMPFYLLLHGRNLKDVQQTLGTLVREIIKRRYGRFETTGSSTKVSGQDKRIRLGIVSEHFNDHTVWKCVTRGYVEKLDREKFELIAYSTGGPRDATTDEARKLFAAFNEETDPERMCEKMRADEPDILLYPGLGLECNTYLLASLRLAPVQCASWGHPITIGLPTIDCYFVSDLIEPENAAEHYSEDIVRLAGLGSYYQPLGIAPNKNGLAELGVRNDATRFLCLQHLHKYLPQFDEIFPLIAKQVPNAQFLFARKESRLAARLAARLQQSFARFGLDSEQFVTFLPALPLEKYLGLCQDGHVFLDTPLNSGLMTTLEAMEAGAVPVTISGDYMRARQTAMLLEAIGVKDSIAQNASEYVEIAVRLATDEPWRKELQERISAGLPSLYRQQESIDSLEQHLCRLISERN